MNHDNSENNNGTLLVTGASSGIGLAISREMLAAGYQVVGYARDFGKCQLRHNNFQPVEIDLANPDAVASTFKQSLTAVQEPIRALVNNVGIGTMGFLEQLSTSEIQSTINLNFLSQVLVTKIVLPILKQQAITSDIIFMGSEAALQGARQGSVYCASKFAIRGFAQALRQECATSGVRVTLINPGAVRSNFFADLDFEPGDSPDNAIEPDDVASVVKQILHMRPGSVIDEVNLSPMKRVWQRKGTPT